jgi:hypothetical protein
MLLTHASEKNIGNYFGTFTTTLQTKPNHPWPKIEKKKIHNSPLPKIEKKKFTTPLYPK